MTDLWKETRQTMDSTLTIWLNVLRSTLNKINDKKKYRKKLETIASDGSEPGKIYQTSDDYP